VQFLSVGGASEVGWLSAAKLQEFTTENIEAVKLAGFHGVCFDVELTKGEQDLVRAFNRAFAAIKKAGLLVMVTTSHSAPYAASSEKAKELLVDSWVASDHIDIFSPQLYTSGSESSPEFANTPCRGAVEEKKNATKAPPKPKLSFKEELLKKKGPTKAPPPSFKEVLMRKMPQAADVRLYDDDKRAQKEKERLAKEMQRIADAAKPEWDKHPSKCTWERLKPMKAKWMPSIVKEDQYPEVKEYFAKLGITTEGFLQWA